MEYEVFEGKSASIKNGAFYKAKWYSNPKANKKAEGHTITKVSSGVVRLGCDYKVVAHKDNVQPLPDNQQWSKDNPYVIISQTKNGVKKLVRVFTSKSSTHHTQSAWFLDNQPTTIQELVDLGYITDPYHYANGEPKQVEHKDMFNIDIEKLLELEVE